MGCSVSLEERLNFSPAPDGTSLLAQTRDQTITIRHPLLSAALIVLNERFPMWVSFEELVAETTRRVSEAASKAIEGDVRKQLAADILTLYVKRLVRLWVDPPAGAFAASDRPSTTVLARWQSSQKMTVTNFRHERIRLSPPELFVLPLLDGTLDRPALRNRLAAAVARKEFEVREEGQLLERPEARHLDELLEQLLGSLARQGLLVG